MLIVTFHNITGTEHEIGDYDVGVYINRTRIYSDHLTGHKRGDWSGPNSRKFAKQSLDKVPGRCDTIDMVPQIKLV